MHVRQISGPSLDEVMSQNELTTKLQFLVFKGNPKTGYIRKLNIGSLPQILNYSSIKIPTVVTFLHCSLSLHITLDCTFVL